MRRTRHASWLSLADYTVRLSLFSAAAIKDLDTRLLAASLLSEAFAALRLLRRLQVESLPSAPAAAHAPGRTPPQVGSSATECEWQLDSSLRPDLACQRAQQAALTAALRMRMGGQQRQAEAAAAELPTLITCRLLLHREC